MIVIHAGTELVDFEEVALTFAHTATDTALGAHLAGGLTVFLVVASDDGHAVLREGDHLDEIAGAGLGAGGAARALVVVDGGQAVNDMQGVELASRDTITVTQAAELAGLDIGYGIGSRTTGNTVILTHKGFFVGMGITVDHGTQRS